MWQRGDRSTVDIYLSTVPSRFGLGVTRMKLFGVMRHAKAATISVLNLT